MPIAWISGSQAFLRALLEADRGRQGRLTWPFDSKPSIAKDFFEPLLEVAVFRECFHSLKPAVDEFEARLHDQEKIKAGIEERIRERSESVAGVEAKRLQLRKHEQQLESLNEAREIGSEDDGAARSQGDLAQRG